MLRTESKRSSKLFCAVVAGAVFCLAAATSALASNVTATATVTAGTLTLSSSATPSVSVTLNGTDQSPSYTLPMTVADNTGTGNGWHVTITSTTFSTGGGSPHLLSTSASTVTGVTAVCASGTCTNPDNGWGYPMALPADLPAPTAVTLFNADFTTGMGRFTVTPTIAVSIPGNSYAGSYTSTVTVAAVSGP